jgi:glucokinase
VSTNPAASTGPSAIAADLGATKLAVGIVGGAGELTSYREERTPAGTAAVRRLIELVCQAHDDWPTTVCVGIGTTGLVEWPSGTIVWAPDSGLSGTALRGRVEEATGLPAVVDTDVNVAAYGELLYGAGRGAANLIVLTIGTGVGCTLVLNGEVFRGSHGFAGEGGHMTVDRAGPLCRCGNSGCLEAVCSGTALEEAVARLTGVKRTGEEIVAAARGGDVQTLAAVREVGCWLGISLASLVNLLDPERVIVGGGLAEAGDLLFGPARERMAEFVVGRTSRSLPKILPARLGPRAGVIGAGALALALNERGAHAG